VKKHSDEKVSMTLNFEAELQQQKFELQQEKNNVYKKLEDKITSYNTLVL